ncbi:hypothetical protein A2U01_0028439 [Trifolium medium]|uniref:Uncharacterized protein n=1 Tax=Trifolium medium TaxID=97028 RepID=A0A392P6G3_9FABA|nr:hypothetical protein [Trifolium medium]
MADEDVPWQDAAPGIYLDI